MAEHILETNKQYIGIGLKIYRKYYWDKMKQTRNKTVTSHIQLFSKVSVNELRSLTKC